jgi:hypothetical protein
MKTTTKNVEVKVTILGEGRVIRKGKGIFIGGVATPRIKRRLSFTVHREVRDEDGNLSPVLGERGVKGSFQVNITGNSLGYRELGRYFLALAELDTSADEDFHDHIEGIKSRDGQTRLRIICRKNRM